MNVVSARVHDAHRLAGKILRLDGARVRQARPLLDGKGVHVGPDEDGRPRPVGQDADDAKAAESLRHRESRGAQLRRQLG